jgi:hypothetical protein
MPITSQELKDIRDALKILDQVVEGLQNKAMLEEQHPAPEGQPAARPTRLR